MFLWYTDSAWVDRATWTWRCQVIITSNRSNDYAEAAATRQICASRKSTGQVLFWSKRGKDASIFSFVKTYLFNYLCYCYGMIAMMLKSTIVVSHCTPLSHWTQMLRGKNPCTMKPQHLLNERRWHYIKEANTLAPSSIRIIQQLLKIRFHHPH